MKKKINSIAGVTLIEILIGIVISTVMMAAMYTSYNIVNSTYSQVTDTAKNKFNWKRCSWNDYKRYSNGWVQIF